MFGIFKKKSSRHSENLPGPVNFTHQELTNSFFQELSTNLYTQNIFSALFDGDKFPGGFGLTKDFEFVDYWELRTRSIQLFTENLYAAGFVKRLITNIVVTGLTLEATPVGDILGMDDEAVNAWAENVENLHRIWSNNKLLVDWKGNLTEGQLQAVAKQTALVSGDCLVVLRQSPVTGLPLTELIDGRFVRNPADMSLTKEAEERGNRIIHGVEIDAEGRHVAFYVNATINGQIISRRIPAFGENSGRRTAWLIYGTKRLLDDIRGLPLLALIIQSLKEIDRYRDSEQRAAVINSILALFVKKTANTISTRPFSAGAVRRDTREVTDDTGETREFKINKWLPGMAIEDLARGEEPVSFDTKRPNINFQLFEDTIISACSWALEVPPEVAKLAFTNSYSASRMANAEFSIFLNKERGNFAHDFLSHRYENWLISMVLTNRISAPGLLDAYYDPAKFDVFGAWLDSDWTGAIKPHIDPVKEVKAKIDMVAAGFSTRDRSAKELTGMKFSRTVRQLEKENQQLASALKPLIDAGLIKPQSVSVEHNQQATMLSDLIEQIVEEKINETTEMVN